MRCACSASSERAQRRSRDAVPRYCPTRKHPSTGQAPSLRFVQFSIERDWFCMDLPRDGLSFPEAMELLWYGSGFFYVRDKPRFALRGEPEGHDPFRKVYLYGDEESAAEDTAFVFFRVWELPIDTRLYVSSASFGGEHEWERGAPLG